LTDAKLHVAIVNLTSGGLSGGYKKYIEAIVPLVRASPMITKLDVVSPSTIRLNQHPGVRYSYWGRRDTRAPLALQKQLEGIGPDVVFLPTARYVKTGLPTVIMIRNMEPLIAPLRGNSAREGFRNLGRRLEARRSCARADRIIAVSGFVKEFLINNWRIDPQKIGVVPHGVEAPISSSFQIKPRLLAQADDRPVIFTAGSIRPARGLEDVLSAIKILKGRGVRPVLVVAGEIHSNSLPYYAMLSRLIARRGIQSQVAWVGSLSKEEMAWCLSNCAAFVMTSRVEACPNTALEAMAYGVPSIATTNPPMPETFREAAVYYSPTDSAALADQIQKILELPADLRRAWAKRSRLRAASFDWRITAELTVRQLVAAWSSSRKRAADVGEPTIA
jgi:glycosyltransferase involved in cell wall biosynthesis